MEADYLSQGRWVPHWHLLHCIAQVAFQLWGQHSHVPTNVRLITPWKILYFWKPQGGMLSTILGHSDELCVSSSCIGSLGSVQVPSRTCHRSIQTSYCSGTLLVGIFLASHSSQHVWRHSSLLFYLNESCHWCFSGLVLKDLPSLHWTLWLLRDIYCADKESLPQSVRPWQK